MSNHTATHILETYRQILALKLLPRTGWLQRGVSGAESVAEHTFGVAALALLVGDTIPDIDRARVLTIALLHDMAEATLGDLSASATRLLGKDAKHDAERRALQSLFADQPAHDDYLALWAEYAAGGSREARLVKALDRIEMLAQALAYERNGSRALAEFWADADNGWGEEFPVVREMVVELVDARSVLTSS
jgi:putative hydrolase of HD superfamily